MTDMIPLGTQLDENFDLFIEDAIATGCVWAMQSEDGFALCPSEQNPDIDLIPFWSQPEYAQEHCVDEWQDYEPVPVSLEEFLDDWLAGMHEDLLLVGVNFNKDMEGIEIEPLDLLEQIDANAALMNK